MPGNNMAIMASIPAKRIEREPLPSESEFIIVIPYARLAPIIKSPQEMKVLDGSLLIKITIEAKTNPKNNAQTISGNWPRLYKMILEPKRIALRIPSPK